METNIFQQNDGIERRLMTFDSKLDIKESDEILKEATFYYTPFDVENEHGEIFLKGSSLKTISENFKRIKYLKNHNSTADFAPGKLIELGEDNYGAFAKVRFIDTHFSKDTQMEYVEKIITEHSFGFNYIKDKYRIDQANGVLYISEFRLWEVSALTAWGSSQYTGVISLNSKQERNSKLLKTFEPTKNTQTVQSVDLSKIANMLTKSIYK